jgi:hypothetical protein
MLDIRNVALIMGLLGIVVPLGLGVGCAIVWWKSLRRPGIFMMLGVLAMFGLRVFFERLAYSVRQLGILVSPATFGHDLAQGGVMSLLGWELGQAIFVAVFTAFLGFILLRAAKSAQVKF